MFPSTNICSLFLVQIMQVPLRALIQHGWRWWTVVIVCVSTASRHVSTLPSLPVSSFCLFVGTGYHMFSLKIWSFYLTSKFLREPHQYQFIVETKSSTSGFPSGGLRAWKRCRSPLQHHAAICLGLTLLTWKIGWMPLLLYFNLKWSLPFVISFLLYFDFLKLCRRATILPNISMCQSAHKERDRKDRRACPAHACNLFQTYWS